MKTSHAAIVLATVAAAAAVAVPRTGSSQPQPIAPIAPVRPVTTLTPVAPVAPARAAALAAAALVAKPIAPIALRTKLEAFTDLSGRMYGAGPRFVALLAEDGSTVKTFPTSIARPAISPHGASALVLGDLVAKTLFTLDPNTGAVRPLLKLADVRDPAQGKAPGGHLLSGGAFSGVASDGKNVFVAIEAGFSSAVFKIDPATKQIVERAWAAAADPEAMVAYAGSLFVLVENGSRIRRFTDALERNKTTIELPRAGARGIGIRAGEIRVLEPTQIQRTSINATELTRATILQNVDRHVITLQPARPIKVRPILSRRYAVLITGDLAENFTGECFWNDTVWMYKSLLANGYDPSDVFVLYGDGADFASQNSAYQHPTTVTNFAATPANVNAMFDGLANGDAMRGIPKMGANDTLFVWTFDHGGQDGGESTLCLRGGSLKASELSAKMNAVSYARRAVFMQQCFSGGFINPLKNAKTFISTAASANEVARPADTENETVGGRLYTHGEYDYYVISALNRLTPSSAPVAADSNSDTWVSSLELHAWEAGHESRPETPQSNDMGGVGSIFRFKK